MDKLNMTGSKLQLANGICLLVVFFSCRLVYGTYSSFQVGMDIYRAWIDPPADILKQGRQVPLWLAAAYASSNLTLHCLNFFWFGKMIDALRRRFDPKPTTTGKSDGRKQTPPLVEDLVVEGTDLKLPDVVVPLEPGIRYRK